MRLGFAGTPEFARVALEALLAAGHEVVLVLTQPDRPAGRGLKLATSPVKQLAQGRGIACLQPPGLRLDGRHAQEARLAQGALELARLDVLVVAAYGLLLPAWVLGLPRLGCLNIHASLLPRWRGAAPIHRAIEAGDAQSGITIMQMDEGLDTGDMLLVRSEPIRPDERCATLLERLARLGAELIVEALRLQQSGDLRATPQPQAGATYAGKVGKAEAQIDWSMPAAAIERRVRAFDPAPGMNFRLGGEVLKLWQAEVGGLGAVAGTVLCASDKALVVACGEGSLALLRVQRPGGRRIGIAELMAGRAPVAVGDRL